MDRNVVRRYPQLENSYNLRPRKAIPCYANPEIGLPCVNPRYCTPGYKTAIPVSRQQLAEALLNGVVEISGNIKTMESRLTAAKQKLYMQNDKLSKSGQRLEDENMKLDKLEDLLDSTMQSIEQLQEANENINKSMYQQTKLQKKSNLDNTLSFGGFAPSQKPKVTKGDLEPLMTTFYNLLKNDRVNVGSVGKTSSFQMPKKTNKSKAPEDEITCLKELIETMLSNQKTVSNVMKRRMSKYGKDLSDGALDLGVVEDGSECNSRQFAFASEIEELIKSKDVQKNAEACFSEAVQTLQDSIVEKDAKIEALKAHCLKLHKFTKQMLKENNQFIQFIQGLGSTNDDIERFKSALDTDDNRLKAELKQKTQKIHELLKMLQDYNVNCQKKFNLTEGDRRIPRNL